MAPAVDVRKLSGSRPRYSAPSAFNWRLNSPAVTSRARIRTDLDPSGNTDQFPHGRDGGFRSMRGAKCTAADIGISASRATKPGGRKAALPLRVCAKCGAGSAGLLGIVVAPGTAARGPPAGGSGSARTAPASPLRGRIPDGGPCSALRGLATTVVVRLPIIRISRQTRSMEELISVPEHRADRLHQRVGLDRLGEVSVRTARKAGQHRLLGSLCS